jgi:hypothetical protein
VLAAGNRLGELDASRAPRDVEQDEPIASRSQFAPTGTLSQPVLKWKIHCDVRPAPVALWMWIEPPRASTRSVRPARPDPRAGSAPADAVVADRQHQAAMAHGQRNLDARGLRVLHRVGQRLGRDVVRRDLDRLGAPRIRRDIKVDRYRGTAGKRPQSRAKAALGKDRREDPARDLLQFSHRAGQSRRDAGQPSFQVAPAGSNIGLRGARRQCERDQSLLGTVVQIALDPAAGLVRRGDDPPARGGQLRPALRIRDRGSDQLGEPG